MAQKGFVLIALILIVAVAIGLIYVATYSAKKSEETSVVIPEAKTLHLNCKKYKFSEKEDFLPKYIVKRGDTLLSVTKKQLGDSSRIGELIEINKEFYPSLSVEEPFIEQGWTLYLPPKNITKTNGKLFEINGELSINKQDGRWGINYPNGGAGPFKVDEIAASSENFKNGDCVKVVYEGETLRVFSVSRQ